MSHHSLSIAAGFLVVFVGFTVASCATPAQIMQDSTVPVQTVQIETTVTAVETPTPSGNASEPTATEAPAVDESEIIAMQPPVLCKPEDPDYSKLSEFWDEEIISAGDRALAAITYSNRNGQKFDIAVISSNDEEGEAGIRTYVKDARVCLEVMTNDSPELVTSAPIDVSQTITDPGELARIEGVVDKVISGEPSPSGLTVWLGVAVPKNWDQEYDRLREELAAGSTLTQTDFAMIEEYASNFGRTEPVFSELESLKGGEIEPQRFAEWFVFDFLMSQEGVVHFSIDPNIAPGEWHNYKARCGAPSARVKMDVSQNDVILRFWRDMPLEERQGIIRQGTSSGWWPLKSTNPARYDALAIGWEKPGRYALDQGWVMGEGCW